MPGSLTIDQKLKMYSGDANSIKQEINADLSLTDAWFIKQMGTQTAGAGFVAWVLWERQTRA